MKAAPSLRTRLLAAVLLATVAVWALLAVSGYLQSRRQLNELMDAHLQQAAELLAAQLTEDGDDGEIELEHVRQIHRYGRRLAFQIWERGQRLRLKSASAPALRLSEGEEGFGFGHIQGQSWRVYSTWAGERQALVQVGEPVSAREQVSREIMEHLLAPLFIALPLLGFALALAIRSGLKPLTELARQVSDRDPAKLEPLDVHNVPLEVHPVVDQLNRLFARIRQSQENERRFTADAAHELRTPLAAIGVQAQVARDASDPAERRHALEQVLAGCGRSAHLIEQLLTLARVDSRNWATAPGHCDLAETARALLGEMGPLAHAKRIKLALNAPPHLGISGNEAWLRVMLRNLVDNAIRYGQSGGHVQVNISASVQGVMLEVCDDGPGIPSQERKRVMDRFYRVAGSGEAGSGLGLSIAGRIASCSGATLTLTGTDGGTGLRVLVRFPPSAS